MKAISGILVLTISILISSCGPSQVLLETADCMPKGTIDKKIKVSLNPNIRPMGFYNEDSVNNTAKTGFSYWRMPLGINVGANINKGITNAWTAGAMAEVYIAGYALGITNKIRIMERDKLYLSFYNKSAFSQGAFVSPMVIDPIRFHAISTNYLLLRWDQNKNNKFTISPHLGINKIAGPRYLDYWTNDRGLFSRIPLPDSKDKAGTFQMQSNTISLYNYGCGISYSRNTENRIGIIELGIKKYNILSDEHKGLIDNINKPALFLGYSHNL